MPRRGQASFRRTLSDHDRKTLKEKDEVIYATCRLCGLRQQTGFIDGICLGLKLAQELNT